MVNISDVAKAAGVSTASISRYLAGQPVRSSAAIERAIAELGYRPSVAARALKTGRHNSIGVIVPDIANPFFANIVLGIESEARAEGFEVVLANSDEDLAQEETQLAALLQRSDGILITPVMEEDRAIPPLAKAGTPVVLVDREATNARRFDRVLVENAEGIALAVGHLTGLGHRDIAFIGGPLTSTPGRARHEGFLAALPGADPEHVVLADFREDGGYAAMRGLWALPRRPTAVVVANNLMTIGALKALREAGAAIPGDVSIVGFDDLTFATLLTPPLTVIDRDARQQGATAARLLFDRILGRTKARPSAISLPVDLIVRGSTASPRKA